MALCLPRALVGLLPILLAACASAPRAAPAPVSQAALDDAGAIAATEMARQGVPGLALVVMQGDRVLLARGFGREAGSRENTVTPDTVFQLNSISKQFVAAATVQLARERRLSLDDPVARHLPHWNHLPPGLRIRHLLSHTSGMRDEHLQPELVALYDRPGTSFADYAVAARATPSDWAPGTRWSYANVNYLMLTLIVEQATGESLEATLERRFFGPLGLGIRLCPTPPGRRPGEAVGHIARDGALVPHPPEPIRLFRGSGGFCGTALDAVRWTRALVTGRVVGRDGYALMVSPAPVAYDDAAEYGLGLALVCPDGARRVGHGGYGGGFSAQLAYYPDADLILVIIANRFVFPEHIERKVARRLLALPEPVADERPLSAEDRRRFVGRYEFGLHGWHPRVEERGDRLWFVLPGPPIAIPLAYRGENLFVNAEDPDGYRLKFSEDAARLRLLGMGLMAWSGERVDSGAP